MAVLVCIPTNSVRGSLFSTSSPAFIACRLLDHSHSNWREMVPHCGFDLHEMQILDVVSIEGLVEVVEMFDVFKIVV